MAEYFFPAEARRQSRALSARRLRNFVSPSICVSLYTMSIIRIKMKKTVRLRNNLLEKRFFAFSRSFVKRNVSIVRESFSSVRPVYCSRNI